MCFVSKCTRRFLIRRGGTMAQFPPRRQSQIACGAVYCRSAARFLVSFSRTAL
jgi:hypothetical protein